MRHLPALCAQFPSYCWTWATNMDPWGRYAPGWFHVGVTKPDDGDALFVGLSGPVGWRKHSGRPLDFPPGK